MGASYTCPNCSKTFVFQKKKGTKGKPKKHHFYRTEGKCYKCKNAGCNISKPHCEACFHAQRYNKCNGSQNTKDDSEEEEEAHYWRVRSYKNGRVSSKWKDLNDDSDD